MANKFDLASIIREQGGPKLTPDAPDLRKISIDLIDSNEGNFYSVEYVKDLMDSISVSGVLQPILVTAQADGRYLLLAGHRRTKATKLLRDAWEGDGENPYSTIPAIVKSAAKNERESLLDELALIQTNAAVRKLSDPELAKQADRMTEILYRLKNLGYPFPGRMREAVAKAVGVSSSKIGRLKAIREHLTPAWLERWETGKMTESGAEALAKLRPEVQDALLPLKMVSPERLRGIEGFYDQTHKEKGCEVRRNLQCDHLDALWKKGMMADDHGSRCETCCRWCRSRRGCKSACQRAKDAAVKADKKAREKEKREQAEAIEKAQEGWRRLDALISAHGISREEAEQALGLYHGIGKRLENPETSEIPAYMLRQTVEQGCSFKKIYQLAKLMGLPPEAITDPDWEPEEPEPEQSSEPPALVLVPKETEDGTVWGLADPDDFVPVGRWYPVDGKCRPHDDELVLLLRDTGRARDGLDDWDIDPKCGVYRDGKWFHAEEVVRDVEWTGVRYWAPWPEMEED